MTDGMWNDEKASMGPQLDSCGRIGMVGESKAGNKLQWGRNLTVAEGRRTSPTGSFPWGFNGAAT